MLRTHMLLAALLATGFTARAAEPKPEIQRQPAAPQAVGVQHPVGLGQVILQRGRGHHGLAGGRQVAKPAAVSAAGVGRQVTDEVIVHPLNVAALPVPTEP